MWLSTLPALEVEVRIRTGVRIAEAARMMGQAQGLEVLEAERTTEVASRSCSGLQEARTLVVDSARMSTLPAGSSQLVAAVQRSRHVADPLQLPVIGTAATLQLLVLTEKPAQVQPKPKLKSLVVGAAADSALASAVEVPVRIVQSEPEGMGELTALAAAGNAVKVLESTARHL